MAFELDAPALPADDKYEAPVKGKSGKSDSAIDEIYIGVAEKSFTESAYHPDSQHRPYNPDKLVQKDYSYGVYEEMMEDDQVSIAMQIKKDLVIGSGWYLEGADESQAELCTELEKNLRLNCKRPFPVILEDILQSYEFGFSVSEKIFHVLENNLLALKDIKPRHPSSWMLHTDPHGNVTRYEQRGLVSSIEMPPNAIIHYINNDRFQNPYGVSDLRTAFNAWMTKRHVVRFYAIYLEKAASATPIAKYDRRADTQARDDIYDAIKKFQSKTALVIPKEFDIEFLESKTAGEAYVKGLNLFNMYIGRALFIPDLLGYQGAETSGGSFSLGQEQIGLFYRHIYKRREILENIIDEHIIRPLCIYNYGRMEEYPRFKFKALSQDESIKGADLWIKAIQGKNWKPTLDEINHFKSLIKFPESDEIEFIEPALPQINPQIQPMPGSGEPKGSGDDEKKFSMALSSLPGAYHKKVDFKVADQLLKSTVSKIMKESEPIVEDIFEDLYDQLQKKKIIPSQNMEKAESISLKYLNKLQIIFKKHFRRLYEDGATQAKTEVKAGSFAKNIPADEFLEFLNQETFKYIGDWSYTITRKTKDELIKAIKDGKPLASVIGVLDDEGKKLSDVSLERFSRTKSTEVFNKGRMEYFESTGIVAAYQYSAILDSVTTDLCASLNGKIFEKGDEPVPPNHWNCRSLLIPITKFEDYKADTKVDGQKMDKFLEENIVDKGFPIS